jgi:DNA-binding YbaB/EbfC family protein
MTDMNKMMQQAQQVQKNIQEAQAKIAQMLVSGEAGAGLVKIVISGTHFAKSCTIDDSVLKEDKETLEDLIVAAVNSATTQIENKSREMMMSMMSGLNLPKEFGGS